ncbi:MAG: hypothetical protein E6Q89_08685 [Bacteroidia bacterium]|nr:MAG: hypothetical protein E6Q89_08685 [Bacteroidia bacterium]
MNKNTDRFISLSDGFVKTLKNAGYDFDYSEKSLKHLEFAINGLKSEKNSKDAKKMAYVYFAVYIAEVFVKEMHTLKLEIQYIGDEIDEVMISDGRSYIYLLNWIYEYEKNPKKESIVKKYRSTIKLISPKKGIN